MAADWRKLPRKLAEVTACLGEMRRRAPDFTSLHSSWHPQLACLVETPRGCDRGHGLDLASRPALNLLSLLAMPWPPYGLSGVDNTSSPSSWLDSSSCPECWPARVNPYPPTSLACTSSCTRVPGPCISSPRPILSVAVFGRFARCRSVLTTPLGSGAACAQQPVQRQLSLLVVASALDVRRRAVAVRFRASHSLRWVLGEVDSGAPVQHCSIAATRRSTTTQRLLLHESSCMKGASGLAPYKCR
jgi:hypothetical protein